MKNLTLFKKTIFGLIATVASKGLANNYYVTNDTLKRSNFNDRTINDLVNQKILLSTKIEGRYILNDKMIKSIFESSENYELKGFVMELMSIIEGDVDVSIQQPSNMVITSQDGGGIKE